MNVQGHFNSFSLMMETFTNLKLMAYYPKRRRGRGRRGFLVMKTLAIVNLPRVRKSQASRNIKDQAQRKIEELVSALANMKPKTGEKVIRITLVTQVRALYLLREEFGVELQCTFLHGSSPRAPMFTAIVDAARVMNVTITEKN